jgi:hypothetical protein
LIANNYYRIKVVDKNGTVAYSSIVTVNICCDKGTITIYPNPVVNKSYTVKLSNMPEGKYQLIMYNSLGLQILTNDIDYRGGSSVQNIKLPSTIAKGTYFIRVFNTLVNYTVPLIIQ